MRFSGLTILCLLTARPLYTDAAEQNIQLCGSVANSRIRFETTRKGHVAFIGGGPFHRHDLYHCFSRGLHYPRTVIFEADLEPGDHTLRLRISSTKNKASQGHAARILQFVAN